MKLDGKICVITGGASGIDKVLKAPYAAARHGLLGLARTIAKEGGEKGDKEFTTVGEVAHTTLFLATLPSNALTGQNIVVSHGWRMG